jgi:hypothetical protein
METAPVGPEEEISMSRKMLRVLAILALVTLTATGAAQASGRTFSNEETSGFATAWDWIAGWFRVLPGMPPVQSNAGPEMDPNGAQTKEGSQMDPDGRPHLNAGSQMDPDGHT